MATFFCSLSGSPCIDPVLSSTGYVFERQVILQYLATHGPICPVSGQSLTPADLYAPTIPSLIPAPAMAPSASTSPVNNGPPSFHTSPQHRALSPDPLAEVDAVALDPRRLSHHSGGLISAAYSSSPGAHSGSLSHHSMLHAQQAAPGVIPDDSNMPVGIPRVPSTSSFRSARRQSRVLSHRNSWHESTFDEPSVPSAPSHRESVALNAQVVDDAALVDQLASEDYRYSAALANAGGQTSHDRLVAQVANMPTYRPYFVWLVTALQTAGLVWSLIWSFQRTGQVIATRPFNFMIGPSADVLVQMGARFTACMRNVDDLLPNGSGQGVLCSIPNPLGKATGLAPGSPEFYRCNWEVMCGDLAGSTQPRVANQWFRFATAMFLHAGVVHFGMNILFQWTAIKSLERDWGWFRIAPVYILAGLFGFIFGGSFSDPYSPSVGCSGALFGMVACLLIDHIQNWRIIHHPTTQLLRMLFVIVITFFLGLFPGIDNFSHVGGFIIGLLMGIVVMPNINLSFCSGAREGKQSPEAKQDSGFGRACFSGYSTASLIARAVCLIVTVALFVAMVPLFYGGNAEAKCSWCHYIDCVPALAPGGQCSSQRITALVQNP